MKVIKMDKLEQIYLNILNKEETPKAKKTVKRERKHIYESKKVLKKKHVIKEEATNPDKYAQYKADIQAYLDKGDGEEYDGFDGWVELDDVYITIAELIAQNKDKFADLESEVRAFVTSSRGDDEGYEYATSYGLYQDIIEGNEGYAHSNIFGGLTDPETWEQAGITVPEELAVILKAYYIDVAEGCSQWDDDFSDERCQQELNKMGFGKVVDIIERMRSGDYDYEYEELKHDGDKALSESFGKEIVEYAKQLGVQIPAEVDYYQLDCNFGPSTNGCLDLDELKELDVETQKNMLTRLFKAAAQKHTFVKKSSPIKYESKKVNTKRHIIKEAAKLSKSDARIKRHLIKESKIRRK